MKLYLCYLRDYFTGSIEDMCSLWDKIRGFQMESDKLEERILTWSVFVRSHPKWEQEMLESYIRQSGKRACHSGIPDVSCDRLFYGRKTAFGSDV